MAKHSPQRKEDHGSNSALVGMFYILSQPLAQRQLDVFGPLDGTKMSIPLSNKDFRATKNTKINSSVLDPRSLQSEVRNRVRTIFW